MNSRFFSGCFGAKLDNKNRFVLPQNFRYELVEDGALEFTIALSMGGCLAIYRKSDIKKIVEGFKAKQHVAKYQKFFTLFFSTLLHTTCDKIGRITLPQVLKDAVEIESELVLAGAMSKIEIWPKKRYDTHLQSFLTSAKGEDSSLAEIMEEAFSSLDDAKESLEDIVGRVQQTVEV